MQISKVLALRGPNIWANFPVLEAWVDLGELKDTSSEQMPGFNDRVMSWLPTMIEHRCSVGTRGGFFERLRRGTYLAHILEHVTLELQSLAGTEVGFGRARETSKEGVYRVAIEYEFEELAREAVKIGHELCLAAVHNRPFDVAAKVTALAELGRHLRPDPNTAALTEAAKRRGIPFRALGAGGIVQLGWGVRQRRIQAAVTDATGAIAASIASDKELTRTLLSAAGVPVPDGRVASDENDAWEAAEEIGLPVAVRARYRGRNRPAFTNLTTREQVAAAYRTVSADGVSTMVEKHVAGGDFRLLVIGGKMAAAVRREVPRVVGDGRSTVRRLVEEADCGAGRGEGTAEPPGRIGLDAEALELLASQGFAPDSVPPAGAQVQIRREADRHSGGRAVDVTDLVHPDLAARAVEAARIVGLDVAGIDVVAGDIGAAGAREALVIGVTSAPDLRVHLKPCAGRPRPVDEAILDHLFPADKSRAAGQGRIPLAAVTGVNGKTTTVRLIAHILATAGRHVGMTCTDGIYFGDRRIEAGDCSGPKSAAAVLMNPQVDAAVLETARGGILRAGLGFDRCDVAVVTNIGEGDHLGLSNIDTTEQLARVKRTIVEVVAPNGAAVLNAADPLTAAMAPHCPGKVIFFGRDPSLPAITARRAEGGRAVFVRGKSVVLADAEREFPLIPLDRVPLTHGGRIGFHVENVLAAAAAAWHMGIPAETIRRGLETFPAGLDGSPVRFNLVEIGGAVLCVDYGHNPSAVAGLIETLEQIPAKRRGALFTVAGDRRDCDVIRQGAQLGDAFDKVVLYEDHYTRGRAPGETIGLMKKGLATGKRVREINEILGWKNSMELVLAALRPGDVWLVQGDTIDETVAFMKSLRDSGAVPVREYRLSDEPAVPAAAAPAAPATVKAVAGATLAAT